MRLAKALFFLLCVQCMALAAYSQKLDPDPDRIFTTSLKWERIAGAPRSEKERVAYGTLAIFYLEGAYAEVSSSFFKRSEKEPLSLNLNEGFVVRLGTWSRTDDDRLIRIESRDVFRDKLPGPMVYRTCRLEQPSTTHIADTIVCTGGLTVSHAQKRIDLAGFPEIVRQLVAEQVKSKVAK